MFPRRPILLGALVAVNVLASLACSMPGASKPAAPQVQAVGDPAAGKSEQPLEPRLTATVEGVEITITEVRLGHPMLDSTLAERPRPTPAKEQSVVFFLRITNRTDTKRLQHMSYARSFGMRAELKDNFGNASQMYQAEPYETIDGVGTDVKTIDPGQSHDDVARFQVPIENAQALTLELAMPGVRTKLGEPVSRPFVLQIPMSMVKRQ
jgi:hypothetical protein